MKLIGMLDSPYVRRVAISAKRLGIPLEHQSVSVFRHFEQFQQINPVVKAPTLVLDDGEVLIDSTLILDYLEALAGPGNSLMPERSRSTPALVAPDRPGAGGVRKVRAALLRTQPAAGGRFSLNRGWSGSKGNWRPPIRRWSASWKCSR